MTKRRYSPRGIKLPGEVLTKDEVARLLDAFPPTWYGVRNRALVATTLYAALRASEVLSLRMCDLDLPRLAITVISGKGSRRGVCGLNKAAIPYLEAWLAERPPYTKYLFGTRLGRKIGIRNFRFIVADAAARAQISHRVHLHALRHTAAVEMARRGIPLHLISKQLRHASIATTAVYLNHFSSDEAVQAVSQLDW